MLLTKALQADVMDWEQLHRRRHLLSADLTYLTTITEAVDNRSGMSPGNHVRLEG